MGFHKLALAAAFIAASHPALAATVSWMACSKEKTGAHGSATGTVVVGGSTVQVDYKGENHGNTSPNIWKPASSFAGGSVDNAPTVASCIVLYGGPGSRRKTITFSVPVANPVIAVFSLGSSGLPAKLVFAGVDPVLEAGGRSAQYGGKSITVSGSVVKGAEGNGTVQLNGTFTSISFTTPIYEGYYAITIGAPSN